MPLITAVDVVDVRFPTSLTADGSDAMNKDGDYSAAYVVLRTDADGVEGYGFTFTIGRGNDLVALAAQQRGEPLVGLDVDDLVADLGGTYRRLQSDSQLRWLGPEKGVVHLATAALVNAVWDLWARSRGVPVWRLVAELEPEQLVACVDLRYLRDELDEEHALDIVRRHAPSRARRISELRRDGYPAYVTSAGWLGYSEQDVRDLCRRFVDEGWHHFKTKVGVDVASDMRRCEVMREEIGDDRSLMADANQVWDVPDAIAWCRRLEPFALRWIEEPTSPDDVLGHAAIRRGIAPMAVATGEHAMNRVLFKQLLQAEALDYVQVDACRLGGLNEVLAVLLLAAARGVPVCPHAGGIGLCEYVQHISIIDYVCISGSLEDRTTEYASHLHEHFVDPVVIRDGRYVVPEAPGYSAQMHPASIDALTFPTGAEWRE